MDVDEQTLDQGGRQAASGGFETWAAMHRLVVAAREPVACLTAIVRGLEGTGGRIRSLHLAPVGDQLEAELRVDQLCCVAARALASRLCDQAGVLDARVEHHLFTPR